LTDKDFVLRKLAELDIYRQQIGEYSAITVEEYQSDWKTQRIIERTLQIMIEVCVDIAHHIISDENMAIPTGYANTFEILDQAHVLPHPLAETMIKMTKFRNILVHQYAEVDAVIVIDILRHRLNDFNQFQDQMVNWLKST